MTYFVLMCH